MKKVPSEDISTAKKRRIEALDKAFGSALSSVLSQGPPKPAAVSRTKPTRQGVVDKSRPARSGPSTSGGSNRYRGEAAGVSEARGVSSETYYQGLDEKLRKGALAVPLQLAEPLKCTPTEFLDNMLTQLMETNPTRVIDARAQIAYRLQDKAGTLLLDNPSSKFNIESAKEKSRRDQQLKNKQHLPKPLMGAHERRNLKLQKLPSDLCEYSLYEPLHDKWCEYVEQLLSNAPGVMSSDTECLPQLATVDLHGSQMRVVRSKEPSRVGVEGLVVMDTCKTFHIISRENRLHVVPKTGSIFEMKFKNRRFAIHGNNLVVAQQAQQASMNKQPGSRATRSTQPNQRRQQNVTMDLL
uniref:Uncharacterized protein n=1 Tax=Pyramimonas obovata TaxID=1411642 RepID=A0A7S0RUB3_9CHLO|mmetsp:Transcript_6575/g.13361  ORF Transcript_6575/g.13361 Transcript_6575/m.13361 type:complete len:353 (+) Transcript_6575:183-1241(+)|eukprot:CAMPEP_0118931110 /NCGR_PEP_ID=MMETSP1169-20130426/7564_1 /TAXON_ID=36882 /ORGANISM="Pyramimonas obovata, Strain CCMP722" /LENGTH=352 /DNA_ID=CAMNT_0006873569 /DNA_START=127 /DNA_END=1185 /DNA_ORIENTATION=+